MGEVKRRVLILDENLSVPFDRRVWQESLALRDAGWDVTVVCPRTERDQERSVVTEGIRIHRYPVRMATKGTSGYLIEYATSLAFMLWLSLRLSRRARFDVVHACNPPDLLFLVAVPLRRLFGTRFLFDQHDLVPELFLSRFERKGALLRGARLLERLTFRAADVVVATNESYRRVAVERGGMDPDRVYIVRSAPPLDRFQRVEPDTALRKGRQYLAAYIGVMGPQDGIDMALKALARYRDDLGRDDLHTIFMGGGDAYDESIALCHALGLDDRVDFPGRVPDEFVARVLSSADIALAPDPKNPLNYVSNMNNIMEYMVMGLPIVSFDLLEQRVSAGEAAVYVSDNDTAEFARRIAELLDDSGHREQMGEYGRRRVRDELSWEHSAKVLIAAYEALVAGPS